MTHKIHSHTLLRKHLKWMFYNDVLLDTDFFLLRGWTQVGGENLAVVKIMTLIFDKNRLEWMQNDITFFLPFPKKKF